MSVKELKSKLEFYQLSTVGKKDELIKRLAEHLIKNSTICTPSDEQKIILRHVAENRNVVADCVAGSGKTTTILQIAHKFPEKSILSVTYNTMLKNEVKNKVTDYNLKNLTVTNYHSLAVQYYNYKAYNDEELMKIVELNLPPFREMKKYDIVIIDEVQDMTPLLFRFIKKYLADSETNSATESETRLIIMGDKFQTLYRFKGADCRYLLLAEQLYKREFVHVSLSTSFRVPRQIAAFINDVMLDYNRIRSVSDGNIRYITCNPLEVSKMLVLDLQKLFLNGYCYSDVFILNNTLKSPAMTSLENELILKGIPCYLPTSDGNKDETNQVVFSTFHQAKGRERKIVIVYNFDDSILSKEDEDEECSDELYVAVTRAKEHLWLIVNSEHPQLRFLNREALQRYTPFVSDYIYSEPKIPCYTSTSKKIVKFLSEHCLSILCKYNLVTEVETISHQVNLVTKTVRVPDSDKVRDRDSDKVKGKSEDVTDINNLAIPALYQLKQTGTCKLLDKVEETYEILKKTNRHPFLIKAKEKLNSLEGTAKIILSSILLISAQEEVYNKVQQINSYDWITDEQLNECFGIMDLYFGGKENQYEVEGEAQLKAEWGSVVISTTFDIIGDSVYMICTDMTLEGKLMLLFNAWIYRTMYLTSFPTTVRDFYALNIRTGQLFLLNQEYIDMVVDLVCRDKYQPKPFITNQQFIKNNNA